MVVGIVGLGYVGLPLAVAFAQAGHDVVGVDSDAAKVAALDRGESYVPDIASETIHGLGGRIRATVRYDDLAGADAILVCVPTPLTANREPDLAPLLDSVGSVAGVLRRGQLVVVESTTYPGTTREQVGPILERTTGLVAGADFQLAFSPERIDPGRTDFTMRNTPKVVGGLTAECLERAVALYSEVCDRVVPVSTPEAAELTKLLENIFRSVNIALVNEIAIIADRMGIDIWEVVAAADTKPYGFMRFEPGPGMGGHCLPVDPFYLAWRAREFDVPTDFIELAGAVNQKMPFFCAEKISRALNDHGKPVKGSRVAILGVSYKAGVGDLRESPAIKLMRLLAEQGADLVYHDDYVPRLDDFGLRGASLDEALAGADVVAIVTAHPGLDVERVVAQAPLVVDFRGVTRGLRAENLVRL
ncbi:MAG TPA: nucleotide sugar dehydrogenase [Solirubrobacteraceae bacterium]|jgi:UDP-N-acetyl-D-glucosamine dehydrogenase|nr:nucleotide sugar dehydrogenase [Solirubrobacteraceae bacterium]